MALQLVARLGLNSRGFLQGLAKSETAIAKFSRFAGKELAGGAINMAGQSATTGIFSRIFGGAKRVAQEIPGAGIAMAGAQAIGAGADAIQPIVDPFGVKRKMGLALAAAGAGAAFVAKQGVSAISDIKDLAEQSDMATTTVQRLGKAARSVGLDFNDFFRALGAGVMTRKEAAESSEKLRSTYARLGVSLRDLQNPMRSQLDLMQQAVRNAKDVHSDAFRADFRTAFGKNAERLIPAVQALDRDLGVVISERSVNAVDKLSKAFERLGQNIRAAFGEITGQVLDKFQRKLDEPGILGALNKVQQKLQEMGVKTGKVILAATTGVDLRTGGPREEAPAPGDDAFIGPLEASAEERLGQKLYEDQLEAKEKEKVKELTEQIRDIELDAMDTEARKNELLKDRVRILMLIGEMEDLNALGPFFDKSELLAMQLKRAEIEAKLQKIEREDEKKTRSFTPPPWVRDDLAKIGGFTPNVQNSGNNYLDRIATAAERTAVNTQPAGFDDGWP